MKKDNKGFTFIEVIVVMAIMAVLVGMGAQVFGLAENGYIKNASADLKSLMDTAEYNTQAVSAKEWKIEITKEDGSYVAKLIKVEIDSSDKSKTINTEIDSKTLSGGKKLEISFDSSFAGGEISEVLPLSISFEKQSGEVTSVTYGGTTYSKSDFTSGGSGNITISTTNTTSHDKTISVYWNTGKIFMK